ncbi:MAG: Mersacidin decarboxylase [Parachlamydia sp.]|nr:MAG: Mersacidin decarboxylase [Parachlamydia sp.]
MTELDLSKFKQSKLLIGVTGSLAVLALPSYLVTFKQYFKEIRVVMTAAASQFITPFSLRQLCQVYAPEDSVSHVELARWTDIFIVLPATANTLSKAAQGAADNLLILTILSYEKPVLFFPNMNLAIWNQKSVQRNMQQLSCDGHFVCPLNEQLAYEQASGEIKKNCVIPSIEQTLSHIFNVSQQGSNA